MAVKSPAPTSSVIDSATCATSRPRPNRPNEPMIPRPRTQAFVDAHRDRLPRGDDANREANAQRSAAPSRRARRHQASPSETSQVRGRPSATPSRLGRSPTRAEPHPRTPPPTAGSRRRSSCQNTRRALPPSARRIATWCRRVSERASVEARKVGARDRQEHPHQRQEHPERGAVPVAQSRKARRERRHVQPLTEQRLPLGFGQRGRQRRRLNRRPSREQFRARRVDGHAARETSDHAVSIETAWTGRRRPLASARRAR